MGFEYIYAYLENLQWFFIIGTGLTGIGIAFLIWLRLVNEVDADDWIYMMGAATGIMILFVIVDLSPSMEHIQKVRTTVTKPYVETINPEEINEETKPATLYPSAGCLNSLMCQGR
jgi:hypothetical protein